MSSHLVPEVRVDKRGVAVTRHVKKQEAPSNPLAQSRPPKLTQEQTPTRTELQYVFDTNIPAKDYESYNSVIRWTPTETLSVLADRVINGDKIERNLITDAFNVNDIQYRGGSPTYETLKELNCIALASDLLPHIPFESWGPLRRIYKEASYVIPNGKEHSNIANIDADTVRAAVLVHATVEDGSLYRNHERYEDALEVFKENHDAILDVLPELMKRHQGKDEIDFDIVRGVTSSPSSLSSGVL